MDCDAIIVGAGIEGSAVAYQLAKRGLRNVLLLEQFDAIQKHGSSVGKSRITRRAYNEPYYVQMMEEAFCMWSDLEKESDTTLYKQTGILIFGNPNVPELVETVQSLEEKQVPHEVFNGEEAKSRYPQLKIPADYRCVFEKDGGILLADKALAAFQDMFLKYGGNILDNHQVSEVIPGPVVTVVTNKGTFQTKQLVITAGAWTKVICSKLGVQLPFEVIRTEVHYFPVDSPAAFSSERFPTFALYAETITSGIPVHEYPGLIKIVDLSGLKIDPCGYEGCEESTTSNLSNMARFIEATFKGVSSKPSKTEYCLVTMSPDVNPVIDRHPCHSNIIIAAGFSGHGFKLSPVIGNIVTEMVMDDKPSYDLTPFRLGRFETA